MKRTIFTKLCLFPFVFITLFSAISCDQAEDTTYYPNGDYGSSTTIAPATSTTTTSTVAPAINASDILSFNNRNGKAVASIDPASDNHLYRATTPKAVTLAKILDDGTLESFFILGEDATVDSWPEVVFMTKSPYTNEIYINFKTDLILTINKEVTEYLGDMSHTYTKTETCKVGQFLCVKEDGTFADILKGDNDTWYFLNTYSESDPILFDQTGNMYYILSEISYSDLNITNAIYKFDPKTNASTIMSQKIENTCYKKFFISKDGKYLFAETLKMNEGDILSAYLRAIPTDSPSEYKDIFYIADVADGFVSSFTVSPDTNTVYYSGNGLGPDDLTGILSASSEDYTKSFHDIQNKYYSNEAFTYSTLFDLSFDGFSQKIYWTENGYVHLTNVSFKNPDGSLNATNLLNCLRDYLPYPESVFSIKHIAEKCGFELSDDTLTNEAAILALTVDHLQLIFSGYFDFNNPDIKPYQFLMDGFGLSENEISASIKYSSQLNVASDGSIWGITLDNNWTETFIRLYDSTGKRSVYMPDAFKGGAYLPIKLQMGEGHIYFSCSITGTDYHTIKCVSLAAPDTLIDVFTNVPDNTAIKISDYSISGNSLYFSGLQGGTTAISGKIDLTGQAFTYSEVAEGFKINKILAY